MQSAPRLDYERGRPNSPNWSRVAELGWPRWVVRLLDIGVLFTADAANVQGTPEVLVGSILLCDLRTLFDWRCNFGWCSVYDDVLLILAPEAGSRAPPESGAVSWYST